MSLTPAQSQAVAAAGNVLVIAGAGTGKTRTLVERCLKALLEGDPPADLEQLLMVTFTEAAAAEMRQRIRLRLEQAAQAGDRAAREHLALFETAQIGTLHSFCLQIVRQHFYELELDPQVAVLAQEETRLLEEETLDQLLEGHYNGAGELSRNIQHLIEVYGRGSDNVIRGLILKLHHYTQTRPDPRQWFGDQVEALTSAEPNQWFAWRQEAVRSWKEEWLPFLKAAALENPVAAACTQLMQTVLGEDPCAAATALREIIGAPASTCPRGKKMAYVNPLDEFLEETRFLCSLYPAPGKTEEPLAQDWEWTRKHMRTLLLLSQEFAANFTRSKRELGLLDFHDLEQYALQLLLDAKTARPSVVARAWQKQLHYLFVDEYQDINAAQDKIIECLSRPAPEGNRFLVGDLKQSIYRFRLADPYIFQGHAATWRKGEGTVIPLVENFRSREGILNCVNSLFSSLMTPEVGGVAYDEEARLVFGNPEERSALAATPASSPAVELHLLAKEPSAAENDADSSLADLQDSDKEARLVGLRLLDLIRADRPVWDEKLRQFRPVQWGDIAVLLRSPYKKAEIYAKEFARLNVPLTVERGGFYESLEVADLLNLLRLLDNPLQDIPAIAVLHSPLVGLSAAELAEIRLALKGRYWNALQQWHLAAAAARKQEGEGASGTSTFEKVDRFLERYRRWRRLARQSSLSRCLEAVLAETHYSEWVVTQSRGEQRRGNVQRLVHLAHQFDRFQRQSLYRFLQFVEAQQLTQSEPEPAGAVSGNSVRLMSIHQSKGLEFPVVVVADLAKAFNKTDLRADVILDEHFGLGPLIQPPKSGGRYPSLPYWLARKRQTRELLGEEMRLLYVAMTRARDVLLLTGSITEGERSGTWVSKEPGLTAATLSARRYIDWIAFWFAQNAPEAETMPSEGQLPLLNWRIWSEIELATGGGAAPQPGPASWTGADQQALVKVQERLAWDYPWLAATNKPAKTSVTTLRRTAVVREDVESSTLFSPPTAFAEPGLAKPAVAVREKKPGRRKKLSAAEVGLAHHRFLERFELSTDPGEFPAEAERLRAGGALSEPEFRALDIKALAEFWSCAPGSTIRAVGQQARRELPFTARFSPAELTSICGGPEEPSLASEHVIVQGVVDLAVLKPEEIWILDFKTDDVTQRTLAEKIQHYAPQLRLYAAALEKIYARPVTRCWLHFLSLRRTVALAGKPELQLSF